MKQIALAVLSVVAVACANTDVPFETIRKWRSEDVPNLIAKARGCAIVEQNARFLSPTDTLDYSFSGQLDSSGLPEGNGTLRNNDGGHVDCFRGRCISAITKVTSTFRMGLANDLTELAYSNGSVILSLSTDSVLHGLFSETIDHNSCQKISSFGGGPEWLFSDEYNAAMFTDSQVRCVFLLEKSVAVCDSKQRNSTVVAENVRTELHDGFLIAIPSGGRFDARLQFTAATNLGSWCNVLRAHATFIRLVLDSKSGQSVFVDSWVTSPWQLESVSTRLSVQPTDGTLKCHKTLDLLMLPEHSVKEHAAVSYPGSGSKWIFALVGTAMAIKNYDLWLEYEPTYFKGSAVLIRTHHYRANKEDNVSPLQRGSESFSWRLEHIRYFSGRAVLLVRNPYDAIVSHWNHIMADDFSVPKQAVDSLKTEAFNKFAEAEIKIWVDTMCDWATIGPEVFVLHYERFVEASQRELRRLLDALHLPVDEKRFECLRSNHITLFKRRGKPILNESVFNKSLRSKFDQAIKVVNETFALRNLGALPLHLYKFYKTA